jgi:serine/threonine protein kinase
MRLPFTSAPLPPDTICGYTVLRSPAPHTYVALADGGREVLLKPLDTDCLLHGQLHPSIKERLARVRELALKSAANLRGIERDRQGVFLVWEFIEGQTLESDAPSLSTSQLTSLMREVVLSVEALHQAGIVHGAMHARNVIIDRAGRPRLTHISPLLFSDPAVDDAAVRSMLLMLIQERTDLDQSISAVLQSAASLRQIASKLVLAATDASEPSTFDADDRGRRKRMTLLALAVAVTGILVALSVGLISARL